jgi:hypothetical protein
MHAGNVKSVKNLIKLYVKVVLVSKYPESFLLAFYRVDML